jgi:hypothetical protein
MIDSLIMFHNKINPLMGDNDNQFFGFKNVALRDGFVYVDTIKGIDCDSDINKIKPWPLGEIIMNRLINMETLEGLTGPINFDTKGRRVNYTINIYKSAMNLPLAKIGTFSTNHHLKILEEAIFRERSHGPDLNRKRIIVSIKDDPFVMLRPVDPNNPKNYTGNERYIGYCVDLAEKLAQIVNFTYEFRLVKDSKFGRKGKKFFFNDKFVYFIILLVILLIKMRMVIGMEWLEN